MSSVRWMLAAALVAAACCGAAGVSAAASDWVIKPTALPGAPTGATYAYYDVAKSKTNKMLNVPAALIVKVVNLPNVQVTHNDIGNAELARYRALTSACGQHIVKLVDGWVDAQKSKMYQVLERMAGTLSSTTKYRGRNVGFSPFHEAGNKNGDGGKPSTMSINSYVLMFGQMVDAVNCLHRNGYVHRNVWHNNWFIAPGRKAVKLGNFGDALSRADCDKRANDNGSPYLQVNAAHARLEFQPAGSFQPFPSVVPYATKHFGFEQRKAFDGHALALSALGLWFGADPVTLLSQDGTGGVDDYQRIVTRLAEVLRNGGLDARNWPTRLERWQTTMRDQDPPMPPAISTLVGELLWGTRALSDVSRAHLPWGGAIASAPAAKGNPPAVPVGWTIATTKGRTMAGNLRPKIDSTGLRTDEMTFEQPYWDFDKTTVKATQLIYSYAAPVGASPQSPPKAAAKIAATGAGVQPTGTKVWFQNAPLVGYVGAGK